MIELDKEKAAIDKNNDPKDIEGMSIEGLCYWFNSVYTKKILGKELDAMMIGKLDAKQILALLDLRKTVRINMINAKVTPGLMDTFEILNRDQLRLKRIININYREHNKINKV